MKRKLSAAAVGLALLQLAAGYTGTPDDVSSAESVSASSSVNEESSFVSSGEEPSRPEETSSGAPSEETTSDAVSDATSDASPGEFSPWREEDEPDLGGVRFPSISEEGFSFLKGSLTLRLGESAAVEYEFKPVGTTNRALRWSSSDETVVKVENGLLTAVGLGKAAVRAETAGGRSAKCRVSVVPEGTLSSLGALAAKLADGNFQGLEFAKYDLEPDGKAELFLRRMGTDGLPTATVYNAGGEEVLTLSTGHDEEWAFWRRLKTGQRYLLLSYTQPTDAGGSRYILEEVSGKTRKRIFARETAPDGSVTYYHASGGGLTACSEDTYRRERKVYFSENRQLPETELIWVKGQNAGEVDEKLRSIVFPG